MSLQSSDQAAASVQKPAHPRVTLAMLQSKIADVEYMLCGPASVVTVCAITMQNGFVIIGKSAPADPANFDKALGEKFALEDATRQAWAFEGYLLREQLHQQSQPAHVVQP